LKHFLNTLFFPVPVSIDINNDVLPLPGFPINELNP